MRRAWKVLAIVAAVLVVVLVAAFAAVQPLARWETRRLLSGLKGTHGTFRSVHVSIRDLSYVIDGLRIDKVDAQGQGHPFVQVEEARAGVYFRELLHGRLVGAVDLIRPRITLVESGRPGERRSPEEAGSIGQRLERMAPLRLDRLQVKGGEVVWVDAREPERPVLRLHGLEATVENFATRAALARGRPTVLAVAGVLQSSGRVQAFATADPTAKALTFAGQGSVRDLALREIGTLLESKTELAPTKGTIDVFARFEARAGKLTGGVRPLVQGLDLKAAKSGVVPKLKEWLSDLALEIFKNEKTDTVATTIPIEGTVQGPQTQAVPTVMAVLRNAFVRGLQGGLQGLPPPKAEHPQSVVEQARRALSPQRGQPRAQPEGKKQ